MNKENSNTSNTTKVALKQKQKNVEEVVDSEDDGQAYPQAVTQPPILIQHDQKQSLQTENKLNFNFKQNSTQNQDIDVCVPDRSQDQKKGVNGQIKKQSQSSSQATKNIQTNKAFVDWDKVQCPAALFNGKCRVLMIIILILLIVGGISIAVLLPFLRRPKISQIKPPKKLKFQGGPEMTMIDMKIKNHRMLSPDTQINVTRTQFSTTPAPQGRNLQTQQNPAETYITVNFQQYGLTVQINPNLSETILVNQTALMDYLTASQHDQRLLENDPYGNQAVKQEDVYKLLSQQFNNEQPLKFEARNYVTFGINQTTKQVYVETKSSRLLFERRILRRKFFNKVKNLVNKVVKPAVQIARKSAPIIGAATGAVVGFVVSVPAGGIPGAIGGAVSGYKIGKTVQVAVKTCVPIDSTRIRCQDKILQKQALKYVVNGVINIALVKP